MFYVGQKVACVISGGMIEGEPPPYAVEGCIYTVAEVFPDGQDTMLQFVELRFDGFEDDENIWHAGFLATAFRPIVERKTDISIFKAMLNPKAAEIDA
jgi:hypothetical protein